MKLQKLSSLTLAIALLTLGAANQALASEDSSSKVTTPPVVLPAGDWTYSFSSLVAGTNAPGSIADFATLSVKTTDYKTFTYDLKLNDLNTRSTALSSAYVSALSVNTISSADPKASAVISGGVTTVTLNTDDAKIGTVTYDFKDTLGNTANPLNGKEEVKWTTTYETSIFAAGKDVFSTTPFVLNVQGIGYDTTKTTTVTTKVKVPGKEDKYTTVSYDVVTHHIDGSGQYAGSSFTPSSVTAVPEPETYAMLLAGLGLMGAIARRRRIQQA
jgi:hypothetical protein